MKTRTKTWKALLICFALGLCLALGGFAMNNAPKTYAEEATEPTYITVTGMSFWDTNSTGGNYYYIFIGFSDVCNGTVTPDPHTLHDNLVINGYTMRELNAVKSGAVSIQGWNQASNTKMFVKVLTDIGEGYGIRKDGTDVVEVKAGLVVRNGYVVSESYRAILNGGFKQISSSDITINSVYFYNFANQKDPYYLFVKFDAVCNGTGTDNNNLAKAMMINGKTYEQINSENAGTLSITAWNQGGGGGVALMISVKNSTCPFNFDGKDTIEIKKNLVVRNGALATDGYKGVVLGSTIYEVTDATPSGETTDFHYFSMYKNQDADNHWLYVNFNSAISDKGIYGLYNDYLFNYIKINDKTIAQHLMDTPNSITFEFTQGTKLLLRIKTSANVFKLDDTDKVEILAGFTGLNGVSLATDVAKVYNSTNNTWEDYHEGYAINYSVNGAVTTVYGEGEVTLSDAVQLSGKQFIGWTTGAETVTDLYKAGEVYDVTEEVTFYAVGVDIAMFDGASVYLKEGRNGIRFDSKINAQDFANLGDRITAMGTLVLPTRYLISTEFKYENFEMGKNCLDIARDGWYAQGEYNEYAGMVIDFASESHYSLEYSARAYVKIAYSDGNEEYFYSAYSQKDNSRSVYQVAVTRVKAGDTNAQYDEYIGKVADIVVSQDGQTITSAEMLESTTLVESFEIGSMVTVVMDGEISSVIVNGVRLLTNSPANTQIAVDIADGTYLLSNLKMTVSEGKTTVTCDMVKA